MTKTVVASSSFRLMQYDAPRLNDLFSRIYSKRGASAIRDIRRAFGLNGSEFGRLFRVSPEAARKWERDGVPVSRLAEVDRCCELASLMSRRLRRDRIPELVRTPAPDFANRTVLEKIRDEGALSVYDYMRRLASGIPR